MKKNSKYVNKKIKFRFKIDQQQKPRDCLIWNQV